MSVNPPRSPCPISMSLDILGDKWTLLVLRDLVLFRKRHYREFLASPEGIATNILAKRLRTLEGSGIVVRSPDPENARQVIYTLTDKGLDLVPVLLDLLVWGAKHENAMAMSEIVRRVEEDRDGLIAEIRAGLRQGS